MTRDVRIFLRTVICLWAAAYAFSFTLEGCAPVSLESTAATAAESAYTADLLRCVDKSSTLAESKACREVVDAKWNITHTTTKDGGR